MKNKISILLLSLITVFAFTACEDEQAVYDGPYRLIVAGPGAANPETTATYSLGDIENPESYNWTVTGPAQIVGSSAGASVEVEFLSVGDVALTVTNGTDARTLNISVGPVSDASVTASFSENSTGALRSGQTDTIYFDFDFDVDRIGSFGFATDNDFKSGSLSDLERTGDNSFRTVYTAGEGNGTPEVEFVNVISTEAYGNDTIKSAIFELPRVDNLDPIANVSYSPSVANDSTVVTITVNFNEEVRFADPADSAIYISLSGAGVEAETDTLMPTEDPMVYTYTYTVNGEGNGNVTVELSNVQDLAGNELALIRNADGLTIDNRNPEILLVEAEDNGDYATLSIVSTEAGTGMYLVMEAGDEAPTTSTEFMEAEGVASGSFNVVDGLSSEVQTLEKGEYIVYFLVMDMAGNFSSIESEGLTMD